jgi:metallophosphoesterase (TIGR03768 family)
MKEQKRLVKGIVLLALILFGGFTIISSGGGGGGGGGGPQVVTWPIANEVFTTAQQQIVPIAVSATAPHINPGEVSLYAVYGYSAWRIGAGTNYGPDPNNPQPYDKRVDLAPAYVNAPNVARLLSFFTMSDIHIADKESPAQPIYVGLQAGYGSQQSSAYSPIILSTPHVLDAAVQTINVLHQRTSFDFGISLGDDANNTQYNELRWYIDVIDGKVITPSSGANAGAYYIDYQRPFKAAGLNTAIPWYAVIGNHDQFWSGMVYEHTKTMNAHVGDTIINMALGGSQAAVDGTGYYMGVVDGSTPYGTIIGAGSEAYFPSPPAVVADANRHTLSTSTNTSKNWMTEFFTTTSNPVGHGFTQANLNNLGTDAACYSFVPKANIPIKVIVLDDTCKGIGQPDYAAGCLDATRLTWLTGELQAGQNNNQLMIIAAHIPVKPQTDINNTLPMNLFAPGVEDSLLTTLHAYPNLMLWISGHRHKNVVTPQPYNPATFGQGPENSFWEVETASLRDLPQEFRTFDIRRNSDNTISIIITNVDPAVTGGSPAEKSRGYAVGAARIYATYPLTGPYTLSYNAELVKQLSPAMQAIIANYGSPIQ